MAKAAILAGIRILTKEMHIRIEDIQQINLAGSFGNVLNRNNAQLVGIIPPAVALSKVNKVNYVGYVGNAAQVGAQINLLRTDTGNLVRSIVRKIKYIELSERTDFSDEFTEAILFGEVSL